MEDTPIYKKRSSDDWKTAETKARNKALIVKELSQLITNHDDMRVAMHLVNILKSSGEVDESSLKKNSVDAHRVDGEVVIEKVAFRDPYFLLDTELLKRIESYRDKKDEERLEISMDNEEFK